MSSLSKQQINKSTVGKSYCKVCQDAGKSEAEYRSHFTRENPDPKSKVVCPTLLAQECRYCLKSGHTVKYCQILKTKGNEKSRTEEISKKQVRQPEKINTVKTKNVFACLDSDDEEEEEENTVKKSVSIVVNKVQPSILHEDFPALSSFNVQKQMTTGNYLAAIASAPKSIPTVEPETAVFEEIANKFGGKLVLKNSGRYDSKPVLKASELDWAALASSSDDDDDDEYDEEDW
jgi:hypothetical protein